jgi:hypothetical protein
MIADTGSMVKRRREGELRQPMMAQGPDGPSARIGPPTVSPNGGVQLARPTPMNPVLRGSMAARAAPSGGVAALSGGRLRNWAETIGSQPNGQPAAPRIAAPTGAGMAISREAADAVPDDAVSYGRSPGDGSVMPGPVGMGAPAPTRTASTTAQPIAAPDGTMAGTPMPPPVAVPGGRMATTSAPPAPAPMAPPSAPVLNTGMTEAPGGPAPILIDGQRDNTNLNPLNDRIRDQTTSWLDNPSPYDDDLWQREVERARVTHDEQSAAGREALSANLARRGVDFGTIGRQGFEGFETDRARAFDRDVLTPMLADRARGIGDARTSAFNAGNQERGYYDNQRNTARDQEIQRIQLEEAIRSGRVGEDQDWLRMILGLTGQTGGAALDAAGMQGNAAGGNANALGGFSEQLARLLGSRGRALPAPAGG